MIPDNDPNISSDGNYPVGLLYLIMSSQVRWIAEVLVNYLSINDPLDLRPHYRSTFDIIESFFYPVGGVLADLSRNRFRLVLLATVILEISAQIILFPLSITENYNIAKKLVFIGFSVLVVHGVISNAAYNVFIIDQFAYPKELTFLLPYVQTELLLKSINQIVAVFLPPLIVSKEINKNISITMTTLCLCILFLSIIIFYAGRRYYVIKEPNRKFVLRLFPCIFLGLRRWSKQRIHRLPHWLDHTKDVYGEELVNEAKAFLRIIFIFLNTATVLIITDSIRHNEIFYSLKIRLGTHDRLVNHARLLLPIASIIAYIFLIKFEPIMKKINFDRPFRRIFLGISFTYIMLFYLTIIATRVVQNQTNINTNNAQIRIFNNVPCSCLLRSPKLFNSTTYIEPSNELTFGYLKVNGYQLYKIHVKCPCLDENIGTFFCRGGEAISIYLYPYENKVNIITYNEIIEIPKDTNMAVATILGTKILDIVSLKQTNGQNLVVFPNIEHVAGTPLPKMGPRIVYDILPDTYKLTLNAVEIAEIDIDVGGIYNIMIFNSSIKVSVTKEPNNVLFYWWLPVGCLHATSLYYYVTGSIDLIYSESPPSLRGTSESFHVVAKGIGILITRQLAPDISLKYTFIYNACLLSIPLLCFVIASVKMKSLYEERKLV